MSRQEICATLASGPPASIALLGAMHKQQWRGTIVALFAEHDADQLGGVLCTEL
jgi:hypothetical protein